MGNFNKRYIIREAECILAECNKKLSGNSDKSKIETLKTKCKKLQRRNAFWKVCTAVFGILFIMAIV